MVFLLIHIVICDGEMAMHWTFHFILLVDRESFGCTMNIPFSYFFINISLQEKGGKIVSKNYFLHYAHVENKTENARCAYKFLECLLGTVKKNKFQKMKGKDKKQM